MICIVCKNYGKVPGQIGGAWVTKPVNNWAKASVLFCVHSLSLSSVATCCLSVASMHREVKQVLGILLFAQESFFLQYKITLQHVISRSIGKSDIMAAFTNLEKQEWSWRYCNHYTVVGTLSAA